MTVSRKEFLLNSFASYIRQTTIATKGAVKEAYQQNPTVADLLADYFYAKFDPNVKGDRQLAAREAAINEIMPKNIALKAVFSMLKAMLRTNFFQNHDYVSFKISSREIHGLPNPKPMAEIFVHSDTVDACHLRFGKIARGGIRWSDRKEDFRTEVLGLVKAQQVKNVVIVPVGSKGAFFPKLPPENATKAQLIDNAIECYKTMIRGILDITDNIKAGKVITPENVVCYDGEDPYLVVAADKGTAEFSDIANALSLEYDFWLGDAFASGGATGYSHKKLAITARGSWESVKRHFNEMGCDCQTEPFTCVGFGSMAGDVFGNAMLLSRQTKLIAAVNSSHIFIDPNPDTEISFAERERLFKEEGGWIDYDTSKISNGGGVYSRKEKMLTISKEACSALGLPSIIISPNDLIKGILAAQVDLLYFGGIGTYVKSSEETQMDVKDANNAACRIDATQMRAKVVGEGANLGMTQRARTEYALRGGRLNTDAIDNSGGVDCSDHEVNLKIMLNAAVSDGKITMEQRNTLLKELTPEVVNLVLEDNFRQTQILSYMMYRGARSIPGNKKLINQLEKAEKLNRALEFLPSDAEMDIRFNHGLGLARPEMCILMAYAKLCLAELILNSDLPDEKGMEDVLINYFPKSLHKEWHNEILKHPLRREIITTCLTNTLINRVGVNLITKLRKESNASTIEIVKAVWIVMSAYDINGLYTALENQSLAPNNRFAMIRRIIQEIENMSLTILREGMDDDIHIEIKRWKAHKDEKFNGLKAEFAA